MVVTPGSDDLDDLSKKEEPLVEEDEETAEAEFDEGLRFFDDDEDLDDATAAEIETGIALWDEPEADGDEPELSMEDLGDVFSAASASEEPSSEGDDLGPLDDAFRPDSADSETFDPDDDSVGANEVEEFVPSEMPDIDDVDDEDTLRSEEVISLALGAEEEPPHAELSWVDVPISGLAQPRRLVVRVGEEIIAGGSDVVRIDAEDGVESISGELRGGAVSLVADGDQATLLVATGAGELFRLCRGRPPEVLESWKDASISGRSSNSALTLGGPTRSTLPAILLRVSTDGVLLESTDRGTTFRRIELRGKVCSLSTGSPPLCVVESHDSLRLFRSATSGGFTAIHGEWPFEADGIELVTEGDIVALLERGRGVHVSIDGGGNFQPVAGLARATAVCAGKLSGRRSTFAALFDPPSGRTSLVWVDAASPAAFVIATLSPHSEDDDDDWAKVLSLTWDHNTESLWGAGKFGVRRWRRPPSA